MAFRVEIAKGAEAQLEELYLWVIARAPHQGAAWFNGLERAILTLEERPERCPVAVESMDPTQPVRVLHYGRRPHVYRVFFAIDHVAGVVQVVHVRRGARQRPTADELTGECLLRTGGVRSHRRLGASRLFERYNIVSPGDLRDAAKRLDAAAAAISTATGTISGTIGQNGAIGQPGPNT
jgi:hypothetical protein